MAKLSDYKLQHQIEGTNLRLYSFHVFINYNDEAIEAYLLESNLVIGLPRPKVG